MDTTVRTLNLAETILVSWTLGDQDIEISNTPTLSPQVTLGYQVAAASLLRSQSQHTIY